MPETLTKDQIFIRKLTDIIIANLGDENFGVKELVRVSGLSRYILTKRLFAIAKKRINQFICEIRLKKALEMLKNEEYTVAEVAYKTGFGSPAYFNRSFHRFFGYPPGEAKKRESIKPDGDIPFDITIKNKPVTQPMRSHIFTFWGALVLAISLGMFGFLLYKKNQKSSWTDDLVSSDGRISIAVMPFRNMTNDTTWNIWQDGILVFTNSKLSGQCHSIMTDEIFTYQEIDKTIATGATYHANFNLKGDQGHHYIAIYIIDNEDWQYILTPLVIRAICKENGPKKK